jgi:hypothetical protein
MLVLIRRNLIQVCQVKNIRVRTKTKNAKLSLFLTHQILSLIQVHQIQNTRVKVKR